MLVITCFWGMFISAAYPVSKVRYFGYFSKLWYVDIIIKKQDMFKKLCGMAGISLILLHLLVVLQ